MSLPAPNTLVAQSEPAGDLLDCSPRSVEWKRQGLAPAASATRTEPNAEPLALADHLAFQNHDCGNYSEANRAK
ncbi:MAG TPA: hypothetical protein VLY24_19635 [Bryobacteraceae bacterium]|nr:hypothetical protein [Bryobacteraceae bacterium]